MRARMRIPRAAQAGAVPVDGSPAALRTGLLVCITTWCNGLAVFIGEILSSLA